MKKINKCKICEKKIPSKSILTRDKTRQTLAKCKSCQFAYLTGSSSKNLSQNKLNRSRLNFKGLGKISMNKDFQNNYLQSEKDYKKYLNKNMIGKKILEIGPSWGAFLSLAKKKKTVPYGLEIDKKKCRFINSKLNINCQDNYDFFKKKNLKFKRIFLFYVIEYFFNPKKELKKILDLLDNDGKIIIITPNYKDILKDVWKNESYIKFFYEKNAKNYFSQKSLKKLLKTINVKNFKIYNKQGYSLLNNINWLINGSPIKSEFVGSDLLNKKFESNINKFFNIEKKKINYIKNLIKKADIIYKNICEKNQLGNNIYLELRKN